MLKKLERLITLCLDTTINSKYAPVKYQGLFKWRQTMDKEIEKFNIEYLKSLTYEEKYKLYLELDREMKEIENKEYENKMMGSK